MEIRLQHRVRGAAAVVCAAALLASGEAPAEPSETVAAPAPATAVQAPAALPASPGPVERLAEVFAARSPEEPLEARVERVRAEASRMGMWSAEPAAHGLLLADELGSPAERAAAAVRLAPGLPAAWAALAASHRDFTAFGALWRGLVEMERNLDASVWWRATALRVLAWALVFGGLVFLAASALWLAPGAAHDLSHRLPGSPPAHAVAALLAGLGVLPAALGEGLAGLAAGAFALALPWAGPRHRGALVAAMAAVLAGVHPVTDETGRWIAALHADPATVAIRNAEVSDISPAERERLERLAPRDPAAGYALALWSKRTGRLADASRWLEVAGAEASTHPVLLNAAANVRLRAGDPDGAIDLYELALGADWNAAILFNLAQVYGSRIDLVEQERVLQSAHAVSAQTVRELSDLRGRDRLAVDLPWPVAELRGRLARAADGHAVAAALRAPFGSGRLVSTPLHAAGGLAAWLLVSLLLGRGRAEAHACALCGVRRCARCTSAAASACPGCGAAHGARSPLDALRTPAARAAERLVPGLAGLRAGQPWLAWLANLTLAAAVAAVTLRHGVVADPLAAGAMGPLAFVLAALLSFTVFALVTAWSLRSAS